MNTKHLQGGSLHEGMAASKARIAERQKIVDAMQQTAQEGTAKAVAMIQAIPQAQWTAEQRSFMARYGGLPLPQAQPVPQEAEPKAAGMDWLAEVPLFGYEPQEKLFGQAVYLASGPPVVEAGTPERLPACYRPGFLLVARKVLEDFDALPPEPAQEQYFLEAGELSLIFPDRNSATFRELRGRAEDAIAEGPRPVYLMADKELRLSQHLSASTVNLLTGEADFRPVPGSGAAIKRAVEARLGRTLETGWSAHIVGIDIVRGLAQAAGPAAPAMALRRAGYSCASWREGSRLVYAIFDLAAITEAEGSEE